MPSDTDAKFRPDVVFNEQRKLDHRLATADHLRENAERNQNPRLFDTADRMEAKAYEHYQKRSKPIGSETNVSEFSGSRQNLGDYNVDNVTGSKLDGEMMNLRDDGLFRDAASLDQRVADAEQTLQHQLGVAQRLREIAAKNGNPNLIGTAERMEKMAVTRYERQIEKFFAPPLESTSVTTGLIGSSSP